MPNDSAIRYLDAATYARQILGDDVATKYFERLHKLARTNSPAELQSIIRGWIPPLPKPLPEPEPEPVPQAPVPQGVGPCAHYGGTWECERCRIENTKAAVRLAGAMALAEQMYQQHRKFVLDRMHTELAPFTNGKPFEGFDDLEQDVWRSVASRIARYEDRSTPLAWLKHVVHGTVVDHFKRAWAAKRGAAVTDQIEPEDEALGDD